MKDTGWKTLARESKYNFLKWGEYMKRAGEAERLAEKLNSENAELQRRYTYWRERAQENLDVATTLRTTLEAVEKERDELREGLAGLLKYAEGQADAVWRAYDCGPGAFEDYFATDGYVKRARALLASREEKKE